MPYVGQVVSFLCKREKLAKDNNANKKSSLICQFPYRSERITLKDRDKCIETFHSPDVIVKCFATHFYHEFCVRLEEFIDIRRSL